MAKRLLFVDDEAMVLEGLRRSLHGMSSAWEMRFAKSAADALQDMADSHFDAIITAIPAWCDLFFPDRRARMPCCDR